MMNVLVVDDDARKANRVQGCIRDFVGDDAIVATAASAADAAALMRDTAYDLLVLDINLPARPGALPRKDGGLMLLRSLRPPRINVPAHIVALTAYDEILTESRAEVEAHLWHVVRYADESRDWEDAIGRKLVHIADSKARVSTGYSTDVAIVTALVDVELEAVLALPANWSQTPTPGDSTLYFAGRFVRGDRSRSVVAAAAPEMGMAAAAALSMKVITTFRPRLLVMCGIAAGVKGQFGDVLIADRAWDYGSGKVLHTGARRSRFHPAPASIPIPAHTKARLAYWRTQRALVAEVPKSWTGDRPTRFSTRLGPIASGAAVVQNRRLVNSIVARDRKLLGVEMEVFGVFSAAHAAPDPKPNFFAAKSICDFGGRKKDDVYQKYAAFTSARLVYEFVLGDL